MGEGQGQSSADTKDSRTQAWGNTGSARALLWSSAARVPHGEASTFLELDGCAQPSSARAAQLCCSWAGDGPWTLRSHSGSGQSPSLCTPSPGSLVMQQSFEGRSGHSRKDVQYQRKGASGGVTWRLGC